MGASHDLCDAQIEPWVLPHMERYLETQPASLRPACAANFDPETDFIRRPLSKTESFLVGAAYVASGVAVASFINAIAPGFASMVASAVSAVLL
jgi:hypothetical protein